MQGTKQAKWIILVGHRGELKNCILLPLGRAPTASRTAYGGANDFLLLFLETIYYVAMATHLGMIIEGNKIMIGVFFFYFSPSSCSQLNSLLLQRRKK